MTLKRKKTPPAGMLVTEVRSGDASQIPKILKFKGGKPSGGRRTKKSLTVRIYRLQLRWQEPNYSLARPCLFKATLLLSKVGNQRREQVKLRTKWDSLTDPMNVMD